MKTSPLLKIALDAVNQLTDEELYALNDRITLLIWDKQAPVLSDIEFGEDPYNENE